MSIFAFVSDDSAKTSFQVNKLRPFETSMRYINTILKQKANTLRRVKFVFRHGSMFKSCGSSSKGAQDLQCVIRLINAIRTFTMNGTKKKKNSSQVNLLKYNRPYHSF